jgi:hypothetical protein
LIYVSQNTAGTLDEGSWMLELVHQHAPDAVLGFCDRIDLDFNGCIKDLGTNFHADIIVDDILFSGQYYPDATADTVAQLQTANDRMVFVHLAGNEQNGGYWQGPLDSASPTLRQRCTRAATSSLSDRPVAPHHRLHQVLQCRVGIGALAGMHGRSLDDGAARRHQPVKSFARRHFPNVPRTLAARANRRNGGQRASDKIHVHVRIDCEQCALIQLDARLQNALHVARENNAGIDELTALDARYDSYNRIVIGAQRAHEWPPGQKSSKTRAAP